MLRLRFPPTPALSALTDSVSSLVCRNSGPFRRSRDGPEGSPPSSRAPLRRSPVNFCSFFTETAQEAGRRCWLRCQVGVPGSGSGSWPCSLWRGRDCGGVAAPRASSLPAPPSLLPRASQLLPALPRAARPRRAAGLRCGRAGAAREAAAVGRGGSGAGSRAQPRPAGPTALAHRRTAWGARRARGAPSACPAGPRTPAQERGRGAAERGAWSRPGSPQRGSGRRRPQPPAPRLPPQRPGRALQRRRRPEARRGCCGDRAPATRAAPAGRRPWKVRGGAALHPLGLGPGRRAESPWPVSRRGGRERDTGIRRIDFRAIR